MTRRIGLVSDTHGLLRPAVLSFLAGCDHIIHAGDIGAADILSSLEQIAPVTAVRGNNDTGAWANSLPATARVRIEDVCVYVIHDIAQLDIDARAAGVRVIISGHSHQPQIQSREGVLVVNPGSAGRRRFKLPISIGELMIEKTAVVPRLARLVDANPDPPAAFVRDA